MASKIVWQAVSHPRNRRATDRITLPTPAFEHRDRALACLQLQRLGWVPPWWRRFQTFHNPGPGHLAVHPTSRWHDKASLLRTSRPLILKHARRTALKPIPARSLGAALQRLG